jgi:hypothetical protein
MDQYRLELHAKLEKILGSKHVYFQPPASLKLCYPCIVYHRNYGDTEFADNDPYAYHRRYSVIVIDPDPDSDISYGVAMLRMCVYDRHYTSDNLNHDVFNVYFH